MGIRVKAATASALAIFLLSGPFAWASDLPGSGDSVRLRFHWPNGLNGTVTYELHKQKRFGERTENIEISGSYRVRVASVADGLLITTDSVSVNVEDGSVRAGPQAELRRIMYRTASTPPEFVVTRAGKFLRLQGLEKCRNNFRSALGQAVENLPGPAKLKILRAVAPMMTRAQLEANILGSWNRDVGAWLDAALDRGELYRLRFTNRVAAFGGLAVPMVSTFKFIDRVFCTPAEADKRCVELESQTFVDSAELARAIEEFIVPAGNGERSLTIRSFRLNSTVRLVTEPHTLIP